MKILRASLLLIALLGFAGWIRLHKPHSPTDDLPPVNYAAFEVHAPSPEAGLALAEAARGWLGVTAATYNPNSGLLVAMFTPQTTRENLRTQLQALAPQRIDYKTFDVTESGPKCPVPHEALAALPGISLGIGAGALALFVLLLVRRRRAAPDAMPAA